MKKLSKIKLNDAAIMSDSEMKYVFGGTGSDTGSSTGVLDECSRNDKGDGCQNDGAACKISTAITGKCTWSMHSGGESVEAVGGCGCKKVYD